MSTTWHVLQIELIDKILSYLSISELISFELVSKSYSNSNWKIAWKSHFEQRFPTICLRFRIEPNIRMKHLFQFQHELENNWKKGNKSRDKTILSRRRDISALSLSNTEVDREFSRATIAVTAHRDRTISLWNLDSWHHYRDVSPLYTNTEVNCVVRCLNVAGCIGDATIVGGSVDGFIQIWTNRNSSFERDRINTPGKKRPSCGTCSVDLRVTMNGHSGRGIIDIASQWNSARLASIGLDNKLNLWDMQKSLCISTLDLADTVAIRTYGEKSFAIGLSNGVVMQWDSRAPTSVPLVVPRHDILTSMAIDKTSESICIGYQSGAVAVVDMRKNFAIWQRDTEKSMVNSVAIDSRKVLVGSSAHISLLSTTLDNKYSTLDDIAITMASSPPIAHMNDTMVVGTDGNGSLALWDFESTSQDITYEESFKQKQVLLIPRMPKKRIRHATQVPETPPPEEHIQDDVVLVTTRPTNSPSRDQDGVLLF